MSTLDVGSLTLAYGCLYYLCLFVTLKSFLWRAPWVASEPRTNRGIDAHHFTPMQGLELDWDNVKRIWLRYWAGRTKIALSPPSLFPRLAWAELTLNPKKCAFFIEKTQISRHQRDDSGIRPSEDKLGVFRKWPVPTNKEEFPRSDSIENDLLLCDAAKKKIEQGQFLIVSYVSENAQRQKLKHGYNQARKVTKSDSLDPWAPSRPANPTIL